MSSKTWILVLISVGLAANSSPALAQQVGGFPNLGNIGPSKAEVVGAIVGAAALIGVVVYLVVPKQKTIEGCVVSGDGGLQFTSDKDKHTYALDTNTLNLQPGQHVTLKGKMGKKHSGTRDFGVNKLVKDKGTCSERATLLTPRQTEELPAPEPMFAGERFTGVITSMRFLFAFSGVNE